MATVSDKKIGVDADNNGIAEYYEAIVRSASDYYPFGWQMPGRKLNPQSYAYGFNGQLTDPEWMGGQSVAFEFRTQDPRLGRFLSTDPLTALRPNQSPYVFAANNPIRNIDYLGLVDVPKSPPAKAPAPAPDPKFSLGDIISFREMNSVITDAKDPPETPGTYEGQSHTTYHQETLGKTYRTVPGQKYRYHTGSKDHEAGWMTEEDYFKMYVDEYPSAVYLFSSPPIISSSGDPIEFTNSGVESSLTVQAMRAAAFEAAAERGRKAQSDAYNNASGRITPAEDPLTDLTFLSIVKPTYYLLKAGASKLTRSSSWMGGVHSVGFDWATYVNTVRSHVFSKKGWEDVIVHGARDGDNFIVNGVLTSPKELARILYARGYKQGTKIRLISCWSGVFPDGAAYQLSRYTKAMIAAPTKRTYLDATTGKWVVEAGGIFKVFNKK